ncbi:MAG: hypothetical protein FWE87_02955, partial [Coriobacteriia bacterium]|nr:hypothetical protein [Coriobacteriia bacterium]
MRTKHHRLFLLLALVMLAGVISAALPLMAGAAIDPSFDGDYWHEYGSECGYSDIQFDPNIITIHSEEDFAKLAYELFYDGMIFDGDPATVILATDLDLGELLWFPVNLDNVRFEGNDHTISNLRVEDLELTGEGWVDAYEFGYAGLFGQLSNSAVLDLTFVDPYISIDMEWWHDSDTTYLGVVAGAAKSSQIREVYIYDPLVRLGDYDGGGGIGNAFVGGVTGYSSDCTIINGAEVFGGEVVIDATRI